MGLLDWNRPTLVPSSASPAPNDASLLNRFQELVTLEEEFPTSLRFTRDGRYLSVGTSQGRVKLYDFSRNACVRTMRTHQERIGCMDWWPSEAGIISAGARTGQTLHHDTRIGRHLVG